MALFFAYPLTRVSLLLAGLLCSLPFLNPWHYYPITTFYEEWLAFLLGVCALLALLRGAGRGGLRIPQTTLWLLGFAAVLLLQLAMGRDIYPQVLLLGLLYVLWAAMMVIVGDRLREELGIEVAVAGLAWFILGAALYSAMLAIIQVYHLDTPLTMLLASAPNLRATANVGQPNLLGNLLALGMGSAIYLHVTGKLRLGWFLAATPLLLVAMSLTVSRSLWLLLAWLFLSALWARRGMAREASSRLLRAVLAMFVMFVALQALIFQFDILGTQQLSDMTMIGRFYERLGSFDVGERVYSVRLYLWQQAWWIFLDHPLLGVGWGQLPWGIFGQIDSSPGLDNLAHEPFAHNLVLQLLAETGLVGAIPIVAGLGLWLWRRLRDSVTPENWWILALAGVELMHSLIEFPLWYAPFLGVLALLLGLGEGRWVAPKLQRLLPLSMIAVLAFSALTLFRTWQDYSRLWTWLYVSLGVRAEQAEALQPYTEKVLGQLGSSLLVAYIDLPASALIGLDHDNLSQKIVFHERVMRFSPTPYVVYRHVLLLALDGREAEALALQEHAMRVYPTQIDRLLQEAVRVRRKEQDAGALPAVIAAARARLEVLRNERAKDQP